MRPRVIMRGMLRVGGWGFGFAVKSHVALRAGSAGTQPLARNVSRVAPVLTVKNSYQGSPQ